MPRGPVLAAFQQLGSRRKSAASDWTDLIGKAITSLGTRPCIARQRLEALRRHWGRYLRCLPLYLAQVARSKDRCEQTGWGGALQTGSRDARCNTFPFVRLLPLRSPRRRADGGCDHFCSSAFTTRECAGPDVIFCSGGSAPDRIFTYTQIYHPPDCASRWREANIWSRGALNSN